MSDNKRILIVGGVAGGASCAARARRLSESAKIIIFDRGTLCQFLPTAAYPIMSVI